METTSSSQFAGRRIAITGASRGIGASAARGFAAGGATVALLHHPDPEMARLARELREDLRAIGGSAETFGFDLGEPAAIDAGFRAVAEAIGPVDVLINNAAVSRVGAWDELSVDDWDHMMAVNVRAAWLCSRAVAPGMGEAGWGRIVNVSSIEYRLGTGVALAYVTSKAALLGLTRSLASALGDRGVCVNAVMPGAIKTALETEAYGSSPQRDKEWIDRQCVPRRGLPEDLFGIFAYLASPLSDFTSGQVFTIDGGATFG